MGTIGFVDGVFFPANAEAPLSPLLFSVAARAKASLSPSGKTLFCRLSRPVAFPELPCCSEPVPTPYLLPGFASSREMGKPTLHLRVIALRGLPPGEKKQEKKKREAPSVSSTRTSFLASCVFGVCVLMHSSLGEKDIVIKATTKKEKLKSKPVNADDQGNVNVNQTLSIPVAGPKDPVKRTPASFSFFSLFGEENAHSTFHLLVSFSQWKLRARRRRLARLPSMTSPSSCKARRSAPGRHSRGAARRATST